MDIRTVIVCFYFVFNGLIKGLNETKNHEKFISAILFDGNKNVCLGFVWWFLYALLLLKIIFSMKMFVWAFWRWFLYLLIRLKIIFLVWKSVKGVFRRWGKICGVCGYALLKFFNSWKVYMQKFEFIWKSSIRAAIIYFYCMLIDLINDYKNHKNYLFP